MKTENRGRRVRFISSNDPYTRLERGVLGTVRSEDDAGTVHINWDNGSTLGMVDSAGDCFEYVTETEASDAG